MKDKELISVIVPVYKVEQYLEKCVETIINQTYDNLEIILVDDGSPDDCPKLCDELAKKDKRIKVIHKQNGGLSDARNVGFEASKGKFVTFVDSDDYLNIHFIAELYKNITDKNADLSIVGYKEVVENEEVDTTTAETSGVLCFDNKNKFEQLFAKHRLNFVIAWGKLYKRELFDELRFPVGKINEDEFVTHHIIDKCKKICFENVPYYYYLQRANSITHAVFTEKNMNVFEALDDRLAFFEKMPEFQKETLYSYLSSIIYKYYHFKKDLRKVLYKKFKFLTKNYSNFVKSFSLKRKIKLALFKYFRIFYRFYRFK